jgi:hypothetical protein
MTKPIQHKKTSRYTKNKNKCKTIKKNCSKKNNKNIHIKNKITQGGFRKILTNEDLNNFKNPHLNYVHGHIKDCCPSVFSLFGMDDENVTLYQELSRVNGLTSENIVEIMNRFYPDYKHIFHQSKHLPTWVIEGGSLKKLFEEIFDTIPKGYGAIGGIQRQDKTKHCIAYGTSTDGDFFLFDVQANKYYQNEEEIVDYFEKNNLEYIYILNSYDAGDNLIMLNNMGIADSGPMEIDD